MFYTGSLFDGKYNFVYDCGSETSQNHLEKIICEYNHALEFQNEYPPELDFVVISHLHKDHYSGLYKLLRTFRVKRLFLPYLGGLSEDALRIWVYHDLFLSGDGNQDSFYVLYSQLVDSYFRKKIPDMNLEIDSSEGTKQLTYSYAGKALWEFVIINRSENPQKIAKINEKCEIFLKKNNCDNMNEFISKNEHNITKIADAYKNVFGAGNKLNNTSTVLLHRPLTRPSKLAFCSCGIRNFPHGYHFCKYAPLKCKSEIYCNCETLLTGDAQFNKSMAAKLEKACSDKTIDVLQVPHHGSKTNWNSMRQNNINGIINVIPFGLGNKYGHPNSNVINNMIDCDKLVTCVTQWKGFDYYIY